VEYKRGWYHFNKLWSVHFSGYSCCLINTVVLPSC